MFFRFGWFLQPNIYSPKEGRRMEANHKSEGLKPVPQYPTFQDGEHLHALRYFERGRLYGKNRSQRCIFQHKNSPQSQEIPEISMEGILVSVQSPIPFGLTAAPRVFSKVMQEAVKRLREKGIQLVQYLDDILVDK